MGKDLPDRLIACSLSASLYSSYMPLEHISRQITRAVTIGNVDRLERLWQVLCERYPSSNLTQCLITPDSFTRKTNLMVATERRAVEMVNWLIENGSEDDGMTKTNEGDTVLHLAAAHDAPEVLALYHAKMQPLYDDEEFGIKLIDWPNAKGASPMCIACQKGNIDSVLRLISLGASIELEDNEGNTPLHYAASYGHLPVVNRLLQHGASAFTKNNMGYTASDIAFSFEVEQEIQNTVRSALEASKRSRKVKGSAATGPPKRCHSIDVDASDDDDMMMDSPGPIAYVGAGDSSSLPEAVMASPPYAGSTLKLQTMGILPPPASSGNTSASSNSTVNPFATPRSKSAPREASHASPSLDAESSKALQRILARDQNAQAGFHASAAYKGLVGTVTGSALSTSPYSTFSKESGYFSSKPHSVFSRERSTSNEAASSTYTASSATEGSSPATSPAVSTDIAGKAEQAIAPSLPPFPAPPIPLLPQLPIPPNTAMPLLPPIPKSSTSSFVSKLRRSGSSSAATTTRHAAGLTSPLETMFRDKDKDKDSAPTPARKLLKHHTSLADLRSQAAMVSSSSIPLPPQTPTTATAYKTTFGLGKSRARSGT